MFPGLRGARTQVGASVGALDDGVLAGIVEDWAFGKRNVCRDASDWYSERREEKETSDDCESWAGLDLEQEDKRIHSGAEERTNLHLLTRLFPLKFCWCLSVLRVNAVSNSLTKPAVWGELHLSLKDCLHHRALNRTRGREENSR